MKTLKKRPKNLDLSTIRLPLPGVVSILHRVSGAVLFLFGIPLVLAGFEYSLSSADHFVALSRILSVSLIKWVLLGFLWALYHHFFAGIRFLFLDVHKGIEIHKARHTASWVLMASLALTLLTGVALW
jgi:succinate dehydrogenase / fumarate reductase cytochrome b subunit